MLASQARNAPLTRPRPGHADLVGMQKYDFDESRPVLERASARETAARVALGRVASNFLQQALGVTVLSHVVELGTVAAPAGVVPAFADLDAIDDDPVRCFDRAASAAMITEVETRAEGRRHPGRGGRGGGLGIAAGAGLARALGPPAGRPAGRSVDGHPGDQGRRGR